MSLSEIISGITSQTLPEGMTLDVSLSQDYDAYDGSTKAFTYRFERSTSGDVITGSSGSWNHAASETGTADPW